MSRVDDAQAARNAGISQSVKTTANQKFKSFLDDSKKYGVSDLLNQSVMAQTGASPKQLRQALNNATSGSTSGTTKQSGNGTSSGGGNGPEGYDYPDNYGEDYIDYEAIERARLEAARQAAQEAYGRNMSRIADAYNSASGNLRSNYDSTVDRLNAARTNSMNDVNQDAEKSLREAYINNMLTRKNLNQRLSAMGYNGGATETTMGSLENQYGSSRNGINEVLNKNISNLNQTYGDNLAGALQQYNSAKSNLDLQRMQLENAAETARNNMEASYMNSPSITMDSNYVNALRNVVARQQAYNYNPTAATNNFVAGNVQQAQSAAQGANYAKYLAQAQLEAQQGNSSSQIVNNIYNAMQRNELSVEDGFDILRSLGLR